MRGRISVLGAGSWGTTLARLLALNGWEVTLHCVPDTIADGINRLRHNPLYFPQVELPSNLTATSRISEALEGTDTAYLVVRGRYLPGFIESNLAALQAWTSHGAHAVLCDCTKGLLLEPTERTDAYLERVLPGAGPESGLITGARGAGRTVSVATALVALPRLLVTTTK